MKCLVTGGTGLIGSHLTDYLIEQGHEVEVIDNDYKNKDWLNDKVRRYHKLNLTSDDLNDVDFEIFDVVYHCAAYAAEIMSLFKPEFVIKNNIVSSTRLMKECVKASVPRFVHTSSMATYGKGSPPFKETDYCEPADVYGWSKHFVDKLLQVFQETFGLDYTVVKPYNVYGPRQGFINGGIDPYRNVLSIWTNMILNKKKPFVYGDGLQQRSFTYVDDFIPWFAKAGMQSNCINEVINIGSNEPVSLRQAAAVLCKEMDFPSFDFADGRPQEVKYAYCDTTKAKDLLGFEQKTTFKEGVHKLCEWAKSVGPKHFDYINDYEIEKNVPSQWKKRML